MTPNKGGEHSTLMCAGYIHFIDSDVPLHAAHMQKQTWNSRCWQLARNFFSFVFYHSDFLGNYVSLKKLARNRSVGYANIIRLPNVWSTINKKNSVRVLRAIANSHVRSTVQCKTGIISSTTVGILRNCSNPPTSPRLPACAHGMSHLGSRHISNNSIPSWWT